MQNTLIANITASPVDGSPTIKRRKRSRSHDKRPRDSRRRDAHTSSSTHDISSRMLPLGAQTLDKHKFEEYKPLFASYLEIQKRLSLEEIDEKELKGRWRSFIGKWNRGELAEGWYDPSRLSKMANAQCALEGTRGEKIILNECQERLSGSYDEDEFGPALPKALRGQQGGNSRAGPAIPSTQDLELKRELAKEQVDDMRNALRRERRTERSKDKERIEELAPRAEAGSKERQLEKKKELASSNRAFAAAKEGGVLIEMPETDLMGGDEDDIASFKKRKSEMERQKSERELRREEISRAKREEREQRQREFKEREDRTMQQFIELAKKRFGE